MTLIDRDELAMSLADAIQTYGLDWMHLKKLRTPLTTPSCEGFWARVFSQKLKTDVLVAYLCRGNDELVRVHKLVVKT